MLLCFYSMDIEASMHECADCCLLGLRCALKMALSVKYEVREEVGHIEAEENYKRAAD